MYFGTKTDGHSITMLYRVVNSEYFPTYLAEYVMLLSLRLMSEMMTCILVAHREIIEI